MIFATLMPPHDEAQTKCDVSFFFGVDGDMQERRCWRYVVVESSREAFHPKVQGHILFEQLFQIQMFGGSYLERASSDFDQLACTC